MFSMHKSTLIRLFSLSIGLLILCIACIDKFVLPEDLNTSGNSSAGDTTYLFISPIWDQTYGLISPVELSISADGHVFVADSAASSIFVFEQSGNRLTEFDALTELQDTGGVALNPIDVDVDKKMNVLFIDGSNRIFRWNQYWNSVGIDSFIVEGEFQENNTGNLVVASYGSLLWLQMVNNSNWFMVDTVWSNDQTLIDSLLNPHLFYDDDFEVNQTLDQFYKDDTSQFTAITTAVDEKNHLFVTDKVTNRVIEINYAHNAYLHLGSGEKIWAHQGLFRRKVVGNGTGAGTVNNPIGIDIDYEDNIYYCQQGEVFSVHKIKPDPVYGTSSYISAFQLYQHDIMDIGRFNRPLDIAVDNNQMIYVSNTGESEIMVFNSNGSFFKKAGIEEIQINKEDWVPGDSTSVIIDSTDTEYIIVQKGLLLDPAGIAVDDRGVIYVCDPKTSSIVRFRLSNSLDEDLQPN